MRVEQHIQCLKAYVPENELLQSHHRTNGLREASVCGHQLLAVTELELYEVWCIDGKVRKEERYSAGELLAGRWARREGIKVETSEPMHSVGRLVDVCPCEGVLGERNGGGFVPNAWNIPEQMLGFFVVECSAGAHEVRYGRSV